MIDWGMLAVVLAGAAAGGLVNGLTGTGTAMSALPIWLQALEPPLATQLAASCSVVGQLLTIRQIWSQVAWRRVAPILAAGLAGVPAGVWLLPHVPVAAFKFGVGVLLVAYSAVAMLAAGRVGRLGAGRVADTAAGLVGGVFGGLAGLSGAPMIIWSTLQGWTKLERRTIFQLFNLTVLSAMLAGNAASGRMADNFLPTLALALPASIGGVLIGAALYRRLSDRGFERAVLWLLLVAGLGLVVTNA